MKIDRSRPGLNVSNSQFQPHQIVCLEGEKAKLYSEVIQIIYHSPAQKTSSEREKGWIRPLLLIDDQEESHDVRETVDLLWFLNQLRPAFDTEVFSFLMQLPPSELPLSHRETARQHLNHFLQQFWKERSETTS